jgi:signal transduction histidine kinase
MDTQIENDKYTELKKEYEDFTYKVSHDLKAPLRAINTISDWIEEDFGDNLNGEMKKSFTMLKDRVNSMNLMIDALTVLSRVERKQLDITDFCILSFLQELQRYYENTYPQVSFKIDCIVPLVKTYKKKIQFVINEVILNAIKHNQEAEKLNIIIRSRLLENELLLEISDNGKGVSEKVLPRLFEVFYTVLPKSETESIGAGLTVCKKILDFVNGKISINSIEDVETKINIKWPV